MATKENINISSVAPHTTPNTENHSDSTSERGHDEDEEVSVGSPEGGDRESRDPQDPTSIDSDPELQHPTPTTNGTSTTSALRVFRGRKRRSSAAEDSADTEDCDRPLDFSSAVKDESDAGSNDQIGHSYFSPFKKLEIKPPTSGAPSPPVGGSEPTGGGGSKSKRKSGVAGFSIDDILSHKTAALKEQKEAASQQSIVRPWDIHVGHVSASGGNGGPSAAATAAMAAALHRKQQQAKASGNNGDDQGDSPLDALFQMASKTFEGLKAKSGKELFKMSILMHFSKN